MNEGVDSNVELEKEAIETQGEATKSVATSRGKRIPIC